MELNAILKTRLMIIAEGCRAYIYCSHAYHISDGIHTSAKRSASIHCPSIVQTAGNARDEMNTRGCAQARRISANMYDRMSSVWGPDDI